MDTDAKKNADSPLRVNVEGEELVIRIGINRLDGHETHPELPSLLFDDRNQWVEDVIREINNGDELGGTPLIYMLDKCMIEALEQGSIGVAEDSPTHIGDCEKCEENCVPLRHTNDGQICDKCFVHLTTAQGRIMKNSYDTQIPHVFAEGSVYGPLQTDGFDYLCPDCGGYGFILDKNATCEFCKGEGIIPLNDKRITLTPTERNVNEK